MALLMVYVEGEHCLSGSSRCTDLGKAREEPGFLILINPFEVLQELYRAPQGIEQIDD